MNKLAKTLIVFAPLIVSCAKNISALEAFNFVCENYKSEGYVDIVKMEVVWDFSTSTELGKETALGELRNLLDDYSITEVRSRKTKYNMSSLALNKYTFYSICNIDLNDVKFNLNGKSLTYEGVCKNAASEGCYYDCKLVKTFNDKGYLIHSSQNYPRTYIYNSVGDGYINGYINITSIY